jgi:hypothetical protein
VSHTWLGTNAPWLSQYYGSTPQGGNEKTRDNVTGLDQRSLEDDKRRLAAMAPRWRAQRRERAEQAFQQWRADRQEHAKRLFAEVNGEDWGFPPPSHFSGGVTSWTV